MNPVLRGKIAEWGRVLEAAVVLERNAANFKEAVRPNEFVHVCGHDSSILEFVLERGWGIYRQNRYTRIVWNERNPDAMPFLYKSYEYVPDKEDEDPRPEKPKQAFYDDDFAAEHMTALAIEGILFRPLNEDEHAA